MKLHNGGALGLGTSRKVSGISKFNCLLQQRCNATACSLVSCCSHFLLYKRTCEGTYYRITIHVKCEICEKNISTIFRVWEDWSFTKLNIWFAWTIGQNEPCRRLFQIQTTPPPPTRLDFQHVWPPSLKNSRIPSFGGYGFFLEQPNVYFTFNFLWIYHIFWLNAYITI